MRIDGRTKLDEVLKGHPFLLEFLAGYAPAFAKLRNPLLRNTLGKLATLEQAAAMGEVPLATLLGAIAGEVRRVTGETVEIDGPAASGVPAPAVTDPAAKKEVLKGIIRDLHAGGDVAALQDRFAALVKDVSGAEIGALEQELIDEGLPETEVRRLCDLHVKVFESGLEAQAAADAEAGHPLHTLVEENKALRDLVDRARAVLDGMPGGAPAAAVRAGLGPLVEDLSEIEKHYLKKENQLFPRLEARGVSGPSKVMWAVHDDIRAHLKDLRRALDLGDAELTVRTGRWVLQEIADMIGKEEKVLFPMVRELFDAADWARVKEGEAEVGYAWIPPAPAWPAGGGTASAAAASAGGDAAIGLDTGRLTAGQIDLMMTHLPVDVSFVDENDTVRYYSGAAERIFPRSPGVIGRRVQDCHPPKSLGVVERILEAFKKGERNTAEFWLDLHGRFIHILYIALRDETGAYRGTLEVSQDASGVRALRGERRLLEWDRPVDEGEI